MYESGIQKYVLMDLLWRIKVSIKVVVVHWAGDHINTVILRCVFDQQNLLKILPESCTTTHHQWQIHIKTPQKHSRFVHSRFKWSWIKHPQLKYSRFKHDLNTDDSNTHDSNIHDQWPDPTWKHHTITHNSKTHDSKMILTITHGPNTHNSNTHDQ